MHTCTYLCMSVHNCVSLCLSAYQSVLCTAVSLCAHMFRQQQNVWYHKYSRIGLQHEQMTSFHATNWNICYWLILLDIAKGSDRFPTQRRNPNWTNNLETIQVQSTYKAKVESVMAKVKAITPVLIVYTFKHTLCATCTRTCGQFVPIRLCNLVSVSL